MHFNMASYDVHALVLRSISDAGNMNRTFTLYLCPGSLNLEDKGLNTGVSKGRVFGKKKHCDVTRQQATNLAY